MIFLAYPSSINAVLLQFSSSIDYLQSDFMWKAVEFLCVGDYAVFIHPTKRMDIIDKAIEKYKTSSSTETVDPGEFYTKIDHVSAHLNLISELMAISDPYNLENIPNEWIREIDQSWEKGWTKVKIHFSLI